MSTNSSPNPYRVALSPRFLVVTMAASMLFAFGLGHGARIIIINSVANMTVVSKVIAATYSEVITATLTKKGKHVVLPSLTLPKDKKVPNTMYSSKYYDTSRTVTSESLLGRPLGLPEEEDLDKTSDEDKSNSEASLHAPEGQHLLIDMENVDGSFLNSEEHLARAMVDLVQDSGLTMLSYHCHRLEPTGVSCAGVLLESHVSLHTWPVHGVITLDLFTCGPTSLIPLVEKIERLFGVPRNPSMYSSKDILKKPRKIWSLKRRGFRQETVFNQGLNDKYNFLLGSQRFEMKELVSRKKTKFQEMLVYDVIDPRFQSYESYQKSLIADADTYESKHPEFFLPDRLVYLDGVLQSRRYGDAAYHEALVHPGLFAHGSPVNVAIIGGGEGATLREILKHNTVKRAVMVEIDEGWDDIARNYLPEWTDCSDLVGSTPHCFDDPRVELYFEDAVKWFIDRYQEGSNEEKFDIIIMDALDPGDKVEFSDILFANDDLLAALHRALTPNGIFICQTGESNFLDDPDEMLDDIEGAVFIQKLGEAGFVTVKDYEEPHCRFLGMWGFVVAMKSAKTIPAWYANEAEVALKIRKAAMPTKSGESPFRYFDGSTMNSYQYPSKPVEVVDCRKTPKPEECLHGHGFNPDIKNIPLSSFKSDSTTVYVTEDVPEGSYIAIEECVQNIHIPHSSVETINELSENAEYGQIWKNLSSFMDQNAHPARFYGALAKEMNLNIKDNLDSAYDGTIDINGFTFSVDKMSSSLGEGGFDNGWKPSLVRNYRAHTCAARVAHARAADEKIRDV